MRGYDSDLDVASKIQIRVQASMQNALGLQFVF